MAKLVRTLSIAKEAASMKSAKVCAYQCNSLVSAFGEVRNFLLKVKGFTRATDAVLDQLIVALHRGLELLRSCKSDDWVVRSLLCHESREEFQDIYAEVFSCVELLSVRLLQLATTDTRRHSVLEAWNTFFRTRIEDMNLENAARNDREQLLAMASAHVGKKKQKYLQMLSDMLEKKGELDKRFAIDHSEIKLQDHISQGAYGTVYEARWLGGAFAIKVFLPGDTSFPREFAVLADHKHPNILGIVGHSYDERKGQYSLVMEKMDMDLAAFLRMKGEALSLVQSLDILVQISKAMAWLHSKEVIHRDLKPENVLVSQSMGGEQLVIKVSDFGLARTNFITSRISGATTKRGTKSFMAPDMWESGHYSKKADVYKFVMVSCCHSKTSANSQTSWIWSMVEMSIKS